MCVFVCLCRGTETVRLMMIKKFCLIRSGGDLTKGTRGVICGVKFTQYLLSPREVVLSIRDGEING